MTARQDHEACQPVGSPYTYDMGLEGGARGTIHSARRSIVMIASNEHAVALVGVGPQGKLIRHGNVQYLYMIQRRSAQ